MDYVLRNTDKAMSATQRVADTKRRLRAFRAKHGLSGENDHAPGDILWGEVLIKREINEAMNGLRAYHYGLLEHTVEGAEDKNRAIEAIGRISAFYEQSVGEPYMTSDVYKGVPGLHWKSRK